MAKPAFGLSEIYPNGGSPRTRRADSRSVAVPRYLATADAGDLERMLWIADDLLEEPDSARKVALVQCGRASYRADQLARLLTSRGRTPVSLVITRREQAQAPETLRKLSGAGEVWVFAENLFEAFMSVFATQLTFAMRSVSRKHRLLNGLDDIGLTLEHAREIADFEARRPSVLPTTGAVPA